MDEASPDWVMLGIQHGDGVMLLASRELGQTELQHEAELQDIWWDSMTYLGPRIAAHRFTLTAEMRRYVTILAPDYPTAFKTLFEQWTPEPRQRPALAEGQRELEE